MTMVEAMMTTVTTMMMKPGAAHDDVFERTDTTDAVSMLADVLRRCGFDAEAWKGERIYLSGYGSAVRAYLTVPSLTHAERARPCDGATVVVTSFWKSTKSGLHAKGVKHAILCDLFKAGLISEQPPERWQDVTLAAVPGAKRVIRRLDDDADAASSEHDQII